jgi:putative ABC transport system permease protein
MFAKKTNRRPPLIAIWLLKKITRSNDYNFVLGDFTEAFEQFVKERGYFFAKCWFWFEVFQSLPRFVKNSTYWSFIMLRNYLKIAFRNLYKHKSYSFINLAGLSIGIACCLIIFLHVATETSYDGYHQNVDQIYRILEYRKVPALELRTASIAPVVATTIKDRFPQAENIARIFPTRDGLVEYNQNRFYEDRMFFADPEIFQIFTMPIISGDATSALQNPENMVISQRIAEKYFGNESPIGKTVKINLPFFSRLTDKPIDNVFKITAVIQNPPSNTHFKYDILLPMDILEKMRFFESWHTAGANTYIKLPPNSSASEFEQQIKELANDYVSKDFGAWGQTRHYSLQPIQDIHFQSEIGGLPIRGKLEASGNMKYMYIYTVIAFLILFIGCMNFINLSNARSVFRLKEVGVRKVIGAKHFQLAKQFLGESFFITTFALLFSIALVKILLPFFNNMAGVDLQIAGLIQPEVLIAILGLIITVGTISGLYYTIVLTFLKPDQIFKGGTGSGKQRSFVLKLLVVGQFIISIFLVIGTITVYQQLQFMKSGQLGFQKEQKYVIPFRGDRPIEKNCQTLKTEFIQHPNIIGATASSTVPGRPLRKGYLKWTDDKLTKPEQLNFLACDEDFISQYQIEMVSGRPFEKGRNDENNSFIINEAAVSLLGYESPEKSLGDRLHESWYGRFKNIVGVIKNFHYRGMQTEVEPLYMEVSSSRFSAITLTLNSSKLTNTIDFVESKWQEHYPAVPFEGFFLDDDFDRQYRKEEQIGKLLGFIAVLGLFIASLGLFGLASFIAKHRTKEIGIRKVLGASVPNLIKLLTRDFAIYVAVASIIASPLSYSIMKRWLEDFAFRINISWLVFVIATGVALMIALTTVSFQAIKAARINPVDSLKYE